MSGGRRLLGAGLLLLATAPAYAQEAEDPGRRQPHLDRAQQDGAAHLNVTRQEAIDGGIAWLLAHQNEDGSWGSHHSPRPIEVLADVPGSHNAFRVATTGLCLMALLDGGADSPEAARAISRAVDALLAQYQVKRANDVEHYSVWAFGYGLRALAEYALARPEDPRRTRIQEACVELVGKLARYQALDGGWGYLSLEPPVTYQPSFTSMSFTTATCLIGLARARELGVALPEKMIARAVASVARCETPLAAFTYGELWRQSPHLSVNHPKGAACRVPVCLEALRLFGREVPSARIDAALDRLLREYARFQIAGLRRPIPHESHYGVSGYFYLYGHAYAALLMEQLPADERALHAPALQRAVLLCRQPDGSFWDYPLYSYHKPYGTAYALLALCRLPDPAAGASR